MNEQLGRFGHHPDPATDFEVETDCLTGMAYNRRVGFDAEPDLEIRLARALDFRVGGVPSCVAAKSDLRAIEAELRTPPAASAAPPLAAHNLAGAFEAGSSDREITR